MTETKRVSDEELAKFLGGSAFVNSDREASLQAIAARACLDLRDLRLAHAKAMAVVDAARALIVEGVGKWPEECEVLRLKGDVVLVSEGCLGYVQIALAAYSAPVTEEKAKS